MQNVVNCYCKCSKNNIKKHIVHELYMLFFIHVDPCDVKSIGWWLTSSLHNNFWIEECIHVCFWIHYINLQVVVSIQLYKELCNRASNNSCEKYTIQIYQLELDKKSNVTWQTSKLCLKECSTWLSVLHSGLQGSSAHMTWYRCLSL